MAMKSDFEDASLSYETIEGVSMKPDIVKDGGRSRLLPVFTSYAQIPDDYMENFSFVKVSATYAYNFMNECEDLNGMVLNPFTEYNLELRKKHQTSKENLAATKHYKTPKKAAAKSVENEVQAMIIYNNKKYQKMQILLCRKLTYPRFTWLFHVRMENTVLQIMIQLTELRLMVHSCVRKYITNLETAIELNLLKRKKW